MKILFLCTAHNSLSQRLYLDLTSAGHDVSIEYALSDDTMLDAVTLFRPELVLCPFLTCRVPKQIYSNVLTLIIHPGPPGDAGPSALDWILMGDNGLVDDATQALSLLDSNDVGPGRTHWGVSVLEAIENFDAGPVWAFEQFAIDIDQSGLTKSELYRGHVTRAAITATRCAISRVQQATQNACDGRTAFEFSLPKLGCDPNYGKFSVTGNLPFHGGKTHNRPLLKAAQREFDLSRHTAQQISRRIRCSDSQPGVLSKVFGPNLYVYGGQIEDDVRACRLTPLSSAATKILGFRNQAVCIATVDGKGVWITHIRRPKGKGDHSLWPKVPAKTCLVQLGSLTTAQVHNLDWPSSDDWSLPSSSIFQDIWVNFDIDEKQNRCAYLHFDFYNGAMSTDQCSRLIQAMDFVLSKSTFDRPLHAIVLMGGSYFSNGIALNVIEAAEDPAQESWLNINRIDDVVHYILSEFPARGILTIAAIRGNAAAGGMALAAACDITIAGSEVVLNPAYRAVGLYGSEYHTLSYYGRCGQANAAKLLRAMKPISPVQAQRPGLVDYIFPGTGDQLDDYIRCHIAILLEPGCLRQGFWKVKVDLSPSSLAGARAMELGQMSKDFWSARSVRYHARRFDFVRKVKPTQTPLRFAKHRQSQGNDQVDVEDTDRFDDIEYYRNLAEENLLARFHEQVRVTMGLLSGIDMISSPEGAKVEGHSGAGKQETLFSCYYKVVDLPMTPSDTPSGSPRGSCDYERISPS